MLLATRWQKGKHSLKKIAVGFALAVALTTSMAVVTVVAAIR